MDYLIMRLCCSFLCGVVLSQCGSLIQTGTRNILSSPSTFGLDGFAILWILFLHSISLWLGADSQWVFWAGIPVFYGLGFLYTRFIHTSSQIEKSIFLGIAFNLVVATIFSLWQFLFMAFNKPFPSEVWFGHFRFVNIQIFLQIFATELLLLLGLKFFWKDLRAFTLGPVISRQLQVKDNNLLSFIFISVSLATYMVVCSFGAFAFLGLVFPLIARKLWFKSFDLKGEILLGSALNGLFLMTVDYLCYEFPFYGAEIPVGLFATGMGAVSLVFILWKSTYREFLAKPKK